MALIQTVSPETFLLALLGVLVWTLPWKGYALWLAARNGHRWWFIALLVINTLAILEIVYIFAIGRKIVSRENPSTNNLNQ